MKIIKGNILYILVLTVTATVVCACREEQKHPADIAPADELYNELLSAYKAYADSLSQCAVSDTSTKAQRLIDNFEKRIWDINKNYPADMDARLTQVQNDSLYKYLDLYLKYKARLHVTASQIIKTDSVAVDTTDTSLVP